MPAVTVHCTPARDADVVRFCTLTNAQNFDGAEQLCRERLLTARDRLTSLRWNKDHAIAKAMRGDFRAAYEILAGAHWLASEVEGTPRGKYENEFGIVHARLGRTSLALEHFNAAYQNHRKAGGIFACAQVDTARARALVTRGETSKALRYLGRALPVAEAHRDTLLTAQIFQSAALAFEAQGDYEAAFRSAARSVSILSESVHEAALIESLETRARLWEKVAGL